MIDGFGSGLFAFRSLLVMQCRVTEAEQFMSNEVDIEFYIETIAFRTSSMGNLDWSAIADLEYGLVYCLEFLAAATRGYSRSRFTVHVGQHVVRSSHRKAPRNMNMARS
jgi:hypothetical protein